MPDDAAFRKAILLLLLASGLSLVVPALIAGFDAIAAELFSSPAR